MGPSTYFMTDWFARGRCEHVSTRARYSIVNTTMHVVSIRCIASAARVFWLTDSTVSTTKHVELARISSRITVEIRVANTPLSGSSSSTKMVCRPFSPRA